MPRVGTGRYVAGEFDGLRRCLHTRIVVFSGLKIDKLDDLEAMISRGRIRHVIAAGSLAMALKKGAARLDGDEFCMGVAEDLAHQAKPYYVPPARVEQARHMIESGRRLGVEFILPIDFVLGDGRVSKTINPDEQQFDIGPATSKILEQKVDAFIDESRRLALEHEGPLVAFHNGVFGMFEDPRFENGTKHFVGPLRRMPEAGIEVYVGGGEGGTALERYGQPDWVTHCFTAGGTVLNALGSEPVPYLVALRRAAKKS